MAHPKKPKMLKKPSKPRTTLASMENYVKKVNAVNGENKRRLSKYNSDMKRYESLRNKVSRM